MENREEYTVDLGYFFKMLRRWAWLCLLIGALGGSLGFCAARFWVTPSYEATVKLYVNNVSSGGEHISSSEIDAAQKLVDTYREILHSTPSYESILSASGAPYDTKELAKMIRSGASNGTEVMYVTVTASDPHMAAHIANTVADILPARISEVIRGATVEVIERATPNTERVSPGSLTYAGIGCILCLFGSATGIFLWTLLDQKIHSEAYIIQAYDIPILAKISNLSNRMQRNEYRYWREEEGEPEDTLSEGGTQ